MDEKVRREKKGELAYYVTLFKIEGHETYRAHMRGHKDAFEGERKQWENPPKVTEKKVYRIDRITGEINLREE